MAKFMFLHVGFENPTPEIMEQWGKWFGSFEERQLSQEGFAGGREITKSGTKELDWGLESLTGYNIIEADSMDAAEEIAKTCPFISSIRVYELRSHG